MIYKIINLKHIETVFTTTHKSLTTLWCSQFVYVIVAEFIAEMTLLNYQQKS